VRGEGSGFLSSLFAQVFQPGPELGPCALFELAHALLADAEPGAQFLQRAGLIGHEALPYDELLAVGQLPQGLGDGGSSALAALAAAGLVFRGR